MSDDQSRRGEGAHAPRPALASAGASGPGLGPVLGRVATILRGLTGLAGAVSIAVFAAEVTLPARLKPSMVIGSFHGRIEAADAAAKADAVTALARRTSEAAAQPPAFTTMETDAFREQQKVLVDSMHTQTAVANGADAACVAGQLIPRDNQSYGWLRELLRSGCGVGDQVRQNMMETLRRGGQDNSVLIQRPSAGDGH